MMPSLGHSYDLCTRLARARAGNFYYAFLILPRAQRRAMCALYAFLRITDDLADEPGPVEKKQAALDAWQRGFDQAIRGEFSHVIHPALHDVVTRYAIPVRYFHDLLDGVRWDLMRNRYATFEDLYGYCYRVASTVGLACIRIWGCDNPEAEPYAEACGIAFQLTNILRDIVEDWQQGRVYLPQEDLVRFDVKEEQLVQGPFDEGYRRLMQFEVERARSYYERGRPLAKYLPATGRAVLQVMTGIYGGLLDALKRRGFNGLNGRIELSRWHKLRLLAQALPVRLGWQ